MTRKEQVRNKAIQLMKFHGFNGLTMRLLAKELGIEAASIYNHIDSKDELLENVCFDLAKKFEFAVLEVNDIYFNASEKLALLIKSHVEILCSDLDASSVFIHDWHYLNDIPRQNFLEKRRIYEQEIRKIIQLGIEEGDFDEIDTKFAVITLLSALNATVEWYNPEGDLSPSEVAERLYQFIVKALKKPDNYNPNWFSQTSLNSQP
jgi:AcrR family transcriptional regulator